jgi:hypothetical protein
MLLIPFSFEVRIDDPVVSASVSEATLQQGQRSRRFVYRLTTTVTSLNQG